MDLVLVSTGVIHAILVDDFHLFAFTIIMFNSRWYAVSMLHVIEQFSYNLLSLVHDANIYAANIEAGHVPDWIVEYIKIR